MRSGLGVVDKEAKKVRANMAEEIEIPSKYRIEPENLEGEYLMHVTTRSTVIEILRRGEILPINKIIEGTNGRNPSSKVMGLDAVRGEENDVSLEKHEEELQKGVQSCKQVSTGKFDEVITKDVWTNYGDMKLGRKGDFVYATIKEHAVQFYINMYGSPKKVAEKKDLFVLRWIAGKEEYFIDLQDKKAVKTRCSIPVERLQIAWVGHVKDDSEEAIKNCLLKPSRTQQW